MRFATIVLVAAALTVAACEEKTPLEKLENKVDDAFDRRPGEKARDVAEEVKEAAKDVSDAAKDMSKEIKEGAADVKKSVEEAAK